MATAPLVVSQSAPAAPTKSEGIISSDGKNANINNNNQKDTASFPDIMKRIATQDEKDKGKAQSADRPELALLNLDSQALQPQDENATLPPGGMLLPLALPQDSPLNQGVSLEQEASEAKPPIADEGIKFLKKEMGNIRGQALTVMDKAASDKDSDKLAIIQQQPSSIKAEQESAKDISTGNLSQESRPNHGVILQAHTAQTDVQALIKDFGNTNAEPRPGIAMNSHAAPELVNATSNPNGISQGGDKFAAETPTQAISVPLRHPQWGDELGHRISWMIRQDVQAASIKLNPPHLGPLEVKVSLVNDQVNVSFSSHHAPVRDALDSSMPRLREMLGENGLQLGDSNVTQHSFSQHNQMQQQTFSQQGNGGGGYGFELPGEDDSSVHHNPLYFVSDGAVDIYA